MSIREMQLTDLPAVRIACNTEVQISLSFGGSSWPISPADMNLGPSTGASDQECLGGIFDLGAASSGTGGGGTPSWIVGDTFLVRDYNPRLE